MAKGKNQQETNKALPQIEAWAARLEYLFDLFYKMHAASTFKVALDLMLKTLPEIFPLCSCRLYMVDPETYEVVPFTYQQSSEPELSDFELAVAKKVTGSSGLVVLRDAELAELGATPKMLEGVNPVIVGLSLKNKADHSTGALLLQFGDGSVIQDVDWRLIEKLEKLLPEIVSDHQQLSDAPDSAERFNLILDVGTKIAANIELAPLLADIGKACSELLEAERSSVYIVDEDTDEIFTLFVQGYDIGEIRLPKGKGIAGRIFETGQTMNIEDAYDLDYFDRSWDEKSGYRTKSVLCSPMYDRQGKMIGVFQVLNKQTAKRFTANDERILRTLGSFAAVAIENAKLYREQKEQFDSFIEVLASSVDAKDPTTSNHSMYVTGISVVIAKELNLEPSFVEKIRIAATLHDYGKIAVPDSVLCKPAKLLPCEIYLMNFHVEKTITILSRIRWAKELRDVPLIAGTHHEALDGSGYPLRLKGLDIPYGGRIIAVADIFHAMIQNRPYKRGMPPKRAVEFCEQMTEPHVDERYGTRKGTHLQADIVAALRQWLERNNWNTVLFEAESGWKKHSQLPLV